VLHCRRVKRLALTLPLLVSCNGGRKEYDTTVEVTQVRQFGGDAITTDLELRFVACPGNARKQMRVPSQYHDCVKKLSVGDEVSAHIEHFYQSERGFYRNILTQLGDCSVKVDQQDEANYDTVESCTELKASGMVVGVHCDRTRNDELVAACPWLFTR
jgi:hypothetical protein